MAGWVKFYRSITEWEWYDDANTARLFFHLILTANHEDRKWRGIVIKKGQLVTSPASLAEQLNLTPMKMRTSLKKLEKSQEITIKTTNKYTLVTLCNYGVYQSDEDTDNEQANNQITNNNQITTNKN